MALSEQTPDSASLMEEWKTTEDMEAQRKKAESYAKFCLFMDALPPAVKGYSGESLALQRSSSLCALFLGGLDPTDLFFCGFLS